MQYHVTSMSGRCSHEANPAISHSRQGATGRLNLRRTLSRHRCVTSAATQQAAGSAQPICLMRGSSLHHPNIQVLEVPQGSPYFPPIAHGARLLFLDHSGNVHSLYHPQRVLTTAYYDYLGVLPALVPEGPLLILGTGAGTIARIIHAFFPERVMHGWELDGIVIEAACSYLGMQELLDKGALVSHVGDALSSSAAVEGGAAGIIVDLFADGQLLNALTEVDTWASIKQRLAPGGRVIVNMGVGPDPTTRGVQAAGIATTMRALTALNEAFQGEALYAAPSGGATNNLIAVTGPLFTKQDLQAVLPNELSLAVTAEWQPLHMLLT